MNPTAASTYLILGAAFTLGAAFSIPAYLHYRRTQKANAAQREEFRKDNATPVHLPRRVRSSAFAHPDRIGPWGPHEPVGDYMAWDAELRTRSQP